jgi:Transposase DDE domain
VDGVSYNGCMAETNRSKAPATKPSSVRHTRAIQRDRSKRPPVAPPDPVVAAHLTALIHPATLAQLDHFRQLGLRERVLTLPVMVALVLSMIWRQIGSVATLLRLLNTEGFLWTSPVQVSEQALSQRLRGFPAELFRRVWEALLPAMQERWHTRHRPLPPELAWAQAHYPAVLTVDGSTLDALLRKVGLLRDRPDQPLAGRMAAVLDLCSRLPCTLWYEPDPQAHDQRWWPQLLAALPAGALLVFDLGWTNFRRFAELTRAQVTVVTRAKSNLAYTVERVLRQTATGHEALVWIGTGADRQLVRLIAVLYRGTWYRYLTNERDPARLPAHYMVALYWQRWRIEDAYAIVKRLLGLAYFWVGSENGVQLQLWATWILYAVLVDLTDAVAEALDRPLAALSLEMVYRSLYFFAQAYHRGETSDPVAYLAAHATPLGILQRERRSRPSRFAELTLTLTSGP